MVKRIVIQSKVKDREQIQVVEGLITVIRLPVKCVHSLAGQQVEVIS